MSEKKSTFRLRLNLFDSLVLLVALVVAAVILWNRFAPQQDGGAITPETQTIQYTIRLRGTLVGTGALVQPGDALVDAVKNNSLGSVVSATYGVARASVLDEGTKTLYMAEVPDREDIDIVVRSEATENDAQFLVGGGFEIRVGEQVFVRGPGYMGSGFVVALERGA